MDREQSQRLMEAARAAREQAYAPYSGFTVGAALLCEDGKIYTGCNIENAAYTPTVCAERTAFFKAISEGERAFTAIGIVGAKDGQEQTGTTPCGVCRQVMEEFVDPAAFQILVTDGPDTCRTYTLADLFPEGFGPKNLS